MANAADYIKKGRKAPGTINKVVYISEALNDRLRAHRVDMDAWVTAAATELCDELDKLAAEREATKAAKATAKTKSK